VRHRRAQGLKPNAFGVVARRTQRQPRAGTNEPSQCDFNLTTAAAFGAVALVNSVDETAEFALCPETHAVNQSAELSRIPEKTRGRYDDMTGTCPV